MTRPSPFAAATAFFALGVLALAAPALAQTPASGTFTASRACPATPAIRKPDNPGQVVLEPGKTYAVVGKNKDAATHYLVTIEGAQPPRRWVEIGCGALAEGAAASPGASAGAAPVPSPAGQRATHVLAMSWQPNFCAERTDKTECGASGAKSWATSPLSLHGLWPQPRGLAYCGLPQNLVALDKAKRWDDLPEPELSQKTRGDLAEQMPGVASNLQRHEWAVHGTCFGADAESYFARAAALSREVDASKVSKLLEGGAGGQVTAEAIRAAFDEAFGAGAGARVFVTCQGKGPERRISELQISLAGDVKGSAPLSELIRAAAPSAPGCPSGLVTAPPR
jgi:ribonuclease T2